MKALNLMLHCGSEAVKREELRSVITPKPTHSWCPIPHHRLLDGVQGMLEFAGLSVVQEAHGLGHGGNRYFGLLQVANGEQAEDYDIVVGVRNSHDKTFPAAVCLGAGVFVCDNLSFSGEVKLARKHTRYINRDLPQLINRAVGLLGDHRRHQETRIAAYKEYEIDTEREAHDIIINALDAGVVPASKVPGVLQEWRSPTHDEFKERTVWSLFNSFTEVLKGNARVGLYRTQALHGLMDNVCNLTIGA